MPLLTRDEWTALARLYAVGLSGVEYEGKRYGEAGSWAVLKRLHDHKPPLAREVTRLDPANQTTRYLVIITDAGVRFYEKNRRMYNVFYPP